jgi:polar amino acid transport system permease protein
MTYVFHFGDIWNARYDFLWGASLTLRLSALSMVLSLVFAIFGALLRVYGPKPVRAIIASYVELIRNTPFLIQILIIFFGLPSIGIRIDANLSALLALTLNGTAYTIDIVRAGIEVVPSGQVEAARALGLKTTKVFRFVVLPQALRMVVPPLGSQFILLMLGSSVVSAIAAEELMAVAHHVSSETYRSFEAYIIVGVIYLVLSLGFSAVFALMSRLAFGPSEAR